MDDVILPRFERNPARSSFLGRNPSVDDVILPRFERNPARRISR